MHKSKRGEIATTLTVLSLVLMAAGILTGRSVIQQQTQYQSRAANPDPVYNYVKPAGNITVKSISYPDTLSDKTITQHDIKGFICLVDSGGSNPEVQLPSNSEVRVYTCNTNTTNCALQDRIGANRVRTGYYWQPTFSANGLISQPWKYKCTGGRTIPFIVTLDQDLAQQNGCSVTVWAQSNGTNLDILGTVNIKECDPNGSQPTTRPTNTPTPGPSCIAEGNRCSTNPSAAENLKCCEGLSCSSLTFRCYRTNTPTPSRTPTPTGGLFNMCLQENRTCNPNATISWDRCCAGFECRKYAGETKFTCKSDGVNPLLTNTPIPTVVFGSNCKSQGVECDINLPVGSGQCCSGLTCARRPGATKAYCVTSGTVPLQTPTPSTIPGQNYAYVLTAERNLTSSSRKFCSSAVNHNGAKDPSGNSTWVSDGNWQGSINCQQSASILTGSSKYGELKLVLENKTSQSTRFNLKRTVCTSSTASCTTGNTYTLPYMSLDAGKAMTCTWKNIDTTIFDQVQNGDFECIFDSTPITTSTPTPSPTTITNPTQTPIPTTEPYTNREFSGNVQIIPAGQSYNKVSVQIAKWNGSDYQNNTTTEKILWSNSTPTIPSGQQNFSYNFKQIANTPASPENLSSEQDYMIFVCVQSGSNYCFNVTQQITNSQCDMKVPTQTRNIYTKGFCISKPRAINFKIDLAELNPTTAPTTVPTTAPTDQPDPTAGPTTTGGPNPPIQGNTITIKANGGIKGYKSVRIKAIEWNGTTFSGPENILMEQSWPSQQFTDWNGQFNIANLDPQKTYAIFACVGDGTNISSPYPQLRNCLNLEQNYQTCSKQILSYDSTPYLNSFCVTTPRNLNIIVDMPTIPGAQLKSSVTGNLTIINPNNILLPEKNSKELRESSRGTYIYFKRINPPKYRSGEDFDYSKCESIIYFDESSPGKINRSASNPNSGPFSYIIRNFPRHPKLDNQCQLKIGDKLRMEARVWFADGQRFTSSPVEVTVPISNVNLDLSISDFSSRQYSSMGSLNLSNLSTTKAVSNVALEICDANGVCNTYTYPVNASSGNDAKTQFSIPNLSADQKYSLTCTLNFDDGTEAPCGSNDALYGQDKLNMDLTVNALNSVNSDILTSSEVSDANGDGVINSVDLALIIQDYGICADNIDHDVNFDGCKNALDTSFAIEKLGTDLNASTN